MCDVLRVALSSSASDDGAIEATGITGGSAGGAHVHHTHVPQRLARRPVREQLAEPTGPQKGSGSKLLDQT